MNNQSKTPFNDRMSLYQEFNTLTMLIHSTPSAENIKTKEALTRSVTDLITKVLLYQQRLDMGEACGSNTMEKIHELSESLWIITRNIERCVHDFKALTHSWNDLVEERRSQQRAKEEQLKAQSAALLAILVAFEQQKSTHKESSSKNCGPSFLCQEKNSTISIHPSRYTDSPQDITPKDQTAIIATVENIVANIQHFRNQGTQFAKLNEILDRFIDVKKENSSATKLKYRIITFYLLEYINGPITVQYV